MQSRSTLYKKILTEMDIRRSAAKRDMLLRREELYKSVPEAEEIDRKISLLGVEAAKKTLFAPQDEEKISAQLKADIDALNIKKKELLKSMGYDEKYLEVNYSCKACEDTGFVDGNMCSCFSQRLMDMAYNSSGIGTILDDNASFESFNLSLYPQKYAEDMQIVLNVSTRFAKNFENEKSSLLFYGKPGLGKTHLCTAIAKEVVKKGFTVMYVTAPKLFKAIEDERFGRDEYDEPSGYMQDIVDVDLMIIDDLGTEFLNSFVSSEFFNIINSRLSERKPTIISTNFDMNVLKERYGDRVGSRLFGEYRSFEFLGDDIRVIKKYM